VRFSTKLPPWLALGSPTQRAIAVLVLGQLDARAEVFFHERVDIAVHLASRDPDPAVLEAAAYALGHLADERGRDALLRLHDHSSSGVRLAVAGALPNCTRDGDEDTIDDLEVVEALIELSRDPHDEVRNWATFGLAREVEIDTPAVREALADRLVDSYDEARAEAIAGLMLRHDDRAVELASRGRCLPPAAVTATGCSGDTTLAQPTVRESLLRGRASFKR
jgi:HEAT repeat protein